MLHVIRKVNGTVALGLVSELFYTEHVAPMIIAEEDRYMVRYRNYGHGLMDWQTEWTEMRMPENGVMVISPLSTVHDLIVQHQVDGEWVDAMGVEYECTQARVHDCAAQDGDLLMLVNQDDIVIRARWLSGLAVISPPSFHGFLWHLGDFHVVGHPESRVTSWRHLCKASDLLSLKNAGNPVNVATFRNPVPSQS